MPEIIENQSIQQPTEIERELAYAQNDLIDAEHTAAEANAERQEADRRSRELGAKTSIAKEAMRTILEQVQDVARREYESSVLELFGIDKDSLREDEPRTIELDEGTIEAFLELEAQYYDRSSKVGVEIEMLRFGRQVNDREDFRNFTPKFVGSMANAAAKMKPGAHFVRELPDSSESIVTVAGDDPDHSAAKVIARVYSGRRDATWSIGVIVPLVGEDEPAEFFSQAPSFNIDSHIKELIDRHKELTRQPVHEVHPLDAIHLAGKLGQFGKEKLVQELRVLAEKSLVSVISGDSYTTFPNERTEAPQYSVGRYIEMLSELHNLDENQFEKAIDKRAKNAANGLKWRNRDSSRQRRTDEYMNISADTYEFVRAELIFRRQLETGGGDIVPVTRFDVVDAHAEFFKRGYRAIDQAKANAESVKA